MKFIYLPILQTKIVGSLHIAGSLKKLLLALFLFLYFQNVTAQSGNTITLNFKNKALPTVFKAIKNQSGYVFISGDIDLNKYSITVQLKNATIEEVLNACLAGQGLEYKIVNKTVVITKTTANNINTIQNTAVIPSITGIIQKQDGSPIEGASIAVKGTFMGTITNADGAFELLDIAPTEKISISYIGFADMEIAVNSRPYLGVITLMEEVSKLDEVKVLAYGIKTSERYATGSSVKITSKDIEKQPVGNVMQALQGRVAGLVINQTSGLHGSDISVVVRGQNSLTSDSNDINAKSNTNVLKSVPLYIIDGIAFPGAGINQMASSKDANGTYNYIVGPNGNGSPLSTINPRDIESIEVLKDANATALYGSRGANGVILITTKKGKIGKPTISVDLNSGIGIINTKMSALGLNDYLALRRQAFANDNLTPTMSSAPDLTLWSQTEAKDFKDLLIGDPSKTYTGNLSLSGGNNGMTFMLSGNFSRTGSVFDDNRVSKNYGFHFSSGYVSPDQKFTANISLTTGVSNSNLANTSFYRNAYSLPPNFPLYNPDGSLYWWSQGNINVANPLSGFYSSYENKMNSTSTSLNLKYNISQDFNLSVNTGYNRSQSSQSVLTPSTAGDPNSPVFTSEASYAESVNKNFVIEPQVNFNKAMGNGMLSALVGATYQQTSSEQPFYIEASGFTSDLYLSNLSMATNYKVRNGNNSYKYVSLFGNANYIYKERYIINGNFRRDGSSKFGSNNLYSNFGSVGAAWIFTGEKFLSGKPQWFSFGKIRSSYGVVGSDNVENYSFLATYSSNSSSNYYSGVKGVVPTRLANPDYQWELSRKFEAAVDLGFFQDRLLLGVAYYRNRTSNQLLDYPMPIQTGFPTYVSNLDATVQNSGIEITISSTNIRTEKFTWSTSGNISFVSNKLVAFPGLQNSPYAYSYEIGRPTGAVYALHYTGKDQNGLPTFQDIDNDGIITPALGTNTNKGDLVYQGKSTPDFYGGLSNTLKYDDLQLDFSFTYTVGAKSRGILSQLQGPPGNMANYPAAVIQEMRDLGLEKMYTTAAFSTDFDRLKISDALIQSNSYARLTNVALSYNFPERLSQRMKLSALRAYLQGQNLLLINLSGKTYAGIDPETGLGAVPPLQVLVGGLQFSF